MLAKRSVFLALMGLMTTAAQAEIVEFTVDSTQSRLKGIAGLAVNNSPASAKPQWLGTDEAAFSGVIRLDLTADHVQFLPGTALAAGYNLTPQEPGGVAANYSFVSAAGPLGTASAAVRNLVLGLTSGPIPLRYDRFNNQFQITALSGEVDFELSSILIGSATFPGALPSDDDSISSLSTAGGVQTLTIPFFTSLNFFIKQPNDSYVQITQNIVATRVVPEPGAVLAVVAAGGLILRGRANRRRNPF